MTLDKITVGTLWTMLCGTAIAIVYLFNVFASAADLESVKQEVRKEIERVEIYIAFGQFYDRLDDYDEAIAEGNDELAAEYARQMELLRTRICKSQPDWERCD